MVEREDWSNTATFVAGENKTVNDVSRVYMMSLLKTESSLLFLVKSKTVLSSRLQKIMEEIRTIAVDSNFWIPNSDKFYGTFVNYW